MAKSTMTYDYDSPTVVWTNNETNESKTFDFNSLPEDMKTKIFAYGAQHLLRDRTSAIKDGNEKLSVAQTLFDRLSAGEWKAVRASSGGSSKTTLIVEAIARIKGIDTAAAREIIDGLPAENLKALRANGQVKKVIAEIKLERLNAASNEAETSLDDLI